MTLARQPFNNAVIASLGQSNRRGLRIMQSWQSWRQRHTDIGRSDKTGTRGSAASPAGRGPTAATLPVAPGARSGNGGDDWPPDLDMSTLGGAFTEGICAVGDTMWVAIRGRPKLQA